MQRLHPYIHQKSDWPKFTWNRNELLELLGEVRNLHGRLIGKMETLVFDLRNEALLDTLTVDVLKTSEREGEILEPNQVRSYIAQRLGLEIANGFNLSNHSIYQHHKLAFNKQIVH
jgi:Fic family protein